MSDPDIAANPRRKRLSWRYRIPLYFVAGYVAYCVILFFAQDTMIFPAHYAGSPGALVPEGTQTLTLHIDEGQVVAWYLPAANASAEQPAPLVVFFHGNAELIDYQHDIIEFYHRLGVSVLLPEYRGYGRSDGKPSQQSVTADAIAFYDQVVERPEVDAQRIVIHGRSIGGAVAAQLAGQRTPSVLVVESTGTSVARMAMGYGIPPFLVKHPFYTDRVVRQLDAPVLIMHGRSDEIFPFAHAQTLERIAEDARLVDFDSGHNGLPSLGQRERYESAVRTRLQEAGILPPEAPPKIVSDATPEVAPEVPPEASESGG